MYLLLLDKNECDFRPCMVNSHCVNLPGTYTCPCDTGYDLKDNVCTGENRKVFL